ncbi:CLC-type chloride channel [Trypanosoma cruzi]|uniref:CLC-type chloride channel n=1 Tax=Trypanosoma cruzi TaxID=5693 RepID=A0A2V2USG7_TRYCR|nr:CLC-type chloride channel [Trypanosoma cruzi]
MWRVTEVAVVAAITAVFNFVTPYSSGNLLELLGDAFQDCTPQSTIELCHDGNVQTLIYLLIAATVKLLLCMYTMGTFLPSGILVPSLAIGALYGRAFGIMCRALQESYASYYIFLNVMIKTSVLYRGCTPLWRSRRPHGSNAHDYMSCYHHV